MLLFSLILLAVSAAFLWLSIAIYRGNTRLIHDYHQTKVTDQAAYGKAFGKAMAIIGIGLLVSGIVALWGEAAAKVSLWIMFLSLAIGIGRIVAVQKKYNGGIF